MKIVVACGGVSREREVSLVSGQMVYESLKRQGYDVVLLDVKTKDISHDLKNISADVCFNLLHGSFGEDGCFQAICESIGLLCTGSDVCASALTMNKVLTKQILLSEGLPTLPFIILNRSESKVNTDFPYPWCIKPISEGSSVGVFQIHNDEDLYLFEKNRDANLDYMIEPLADGSDLTVALVADKPLPPIRIKPYNDFYDYHAKYQDHKTQYLFDMDDDLKDKLISLAQQCYTLMGAKGFARVDFIQHQDKVYILEINTIPGMTEHSLVPMAYAKIGKTFDELTTDILKTVAPDLISK